MNQLTKNEINKKFQIILAYGSNFSLEEKHIIEQAVRDIIVRQIKKDVMSF